MSRGLQPGDAILLRGLCWFWRQVELDPRTGLVSAVLGARAAKGMFVALVVGPARGVRNAKSHRRAVLVAAPDGLFWTWIDCIFNKELGNGELLQRSVHCRGWSEGSAP